MNSQDRRLLRIFESREKSNRDLEDKIEMLERKRDEIWGEIFSLEKLVEKPCGKSIKYHMVRCELPISHKGCCAARKWGDRIVRSKPGRSKQ